MKRHRFLQIYHYTIEVNLLYVLCILFYLRNATVPPIYPFLLLVVAGAVFTVFLCKVAKKHHIVNLALSAIVIVCIGHLVDLPIALTIIISLFVCWRVHTHLHEADKKHEVQVLLFTFFSGIVVYVIAWLNDYPHGNIILLLTIFQIALITVGQFIQEILERDLSQSAKRQAIWMLSLLLFMIGLGICMTFALPFIKSIFFLLMKGLFSALGFIAAPFIYFLLYLQELFGFSFNITMNELGGSGGITGEPTEPTIVSILPMISWLLFIVLIIVSIIWFVRSYRGTNVPEQLVKGQVSSSGLVEGQNPFRYKKAKPPKNYIRKLFYDLEKLGAKRDRGRMKGETANEWLYRIGFVETSEMVKSYEKVRYEETSLSEDEIIAYTEMMKYTKQKLKEKR